jgi:hypothetical protein
MRIAEMHAVTESKLQRSGIVTSQVYSISVCPDSYPCAMRDVNPTRLKQ